jgi:peptidoglycan/xylan/chitin deacetylase (PgdA/CDA1 family)
MLTLLLALACVAPQSVALTFDDGPQLAETALLSPAARNDAMLASLAKHHAIAALFVTSANGADRPAGLELARAWGKASHVIGNHTVSHPDLNNKKETLAAFEKDLLDCDTIIKGLPGYQKLFRFPYLHEGNTPEKRDGMRTFLRRQGYRNAYVTIDTSDWRIAMELTSALKTNPKTNLEPFRKVYVSHLLQRANAYRELGRKLFGRDIPQVMLLHHNLLEALFLDDAMTALEGDCWQFTDPVTTYRDQVYQQQPDRAAPGQSLLLSIALSQGVDLKAYSRLVDDGDFEVAQLHASP